MKQHRIRNRKKQTHGLCYLPSVVIKVLQETKPVGKQHMSIETGWEILQQKANSSPCLSA